MEFIKLPELDTPMSRLGLGGCPLGGHGWGETDDRNSIDAVRCALDLGINHFDTADIYGLGHSETILAEALGATRHTMVIASKFGVRRTSEGKTYFDNSPGYLRTALAESLRRLKLDRIPLYYLHWPDGRTSLEESVAALDERRRCGLIGAIGLSNITADQLQRACSVATISAVQVQYSLVHRQQAEALATTAQRFNVPLITWGSLAQGLLTGKYNAQSTFPTGDRRSRYEDFIGARFQRNLALVERLQVVAAQACKSPGQTAMRWLLDQSSVGAVLFGAKSAAQVSENLGAIDWTLTLESCARLTEWTAMESSAA